MLLWVIIKTTDNSAKCLLTGLYIISVITTTDGNAANTKSRFSPPKQIVSLQHGNGVRSCVQVLPSSTTVFILLGNGSVTAITGTLSICNYKMYIFNGNGFLPLSCLKGASPLITTPSGRAPWPGRACTGRCVSGFMVAAAFRLRGAESPLKDPSPLVGKAVWLPQEGVHLGFRSSVGAGSEAQRTLPHISVCGL